MPALPDSESGDQNTTGLSTPAEVTAGPSTLQKDCTRDEDIAEAINEVEQHIYKEAELTHPVQLLHDGPFG